MPDEHLYVLIDRAMFKQVAWAGSKEEYDMYYEQYMQGILLSFIPIALDDDHHRKAV
jgi:hypothetical protein